MRHGGLVAVILTGFLLLYVFDPRAPLPSVPANAGPAPAARPTTETSAPKPKIFRAPDGREAALDLPVLRSFIYPGDAEYCRFASVYNATIADKPSIMDDCSAFAALEPARKAMFLIEAAQDTALQAQVLITANPIGGVAPAPTTPPPAKALAMAISALHEAIELTPADAIGQAQTAFGSYLGEIGAAENNHDPDFLFEDAFVAEFGRARIALCQLQKRDDCLALTSPDVADALMSVGRWKSDLGSLVLSADIVEAIHNSLGFSDPAHDLDFADQFAGSLGYAAEVAEGDAKLAYLRRGVAPLETWYHEHKASYDDKDAVSDAAQTLGSNYGRIAFQTRTAVDVEKSLEYDGATYRLQQQMEDGPSWETMSNYGDSLVLKGEVDRSETDLLRGLDLQRQALAKTLAERGPEDHAYARMKVAQTLSRYVAMPGIDMSRDKRLGLLTEAKRLAEEAQAFFRTSRTPVYLNFVARILERVDAEFAATVK